MNGKYVDPAEMVGSLVRPTPPTDEQVRRARLTVAHAATSRDDCTDLLDMLGLGPDVEVSA